MSLADQSQQWYPTSVKVTVFQARNLKIKGKHGTNDAYAIMQVAKEKFSTAVAEKTASPVWKEEASFDLPLFHQGNADRCTLRVTVMHRALVGMDQLLGQAVINLLELHETKNRSKTEWFKLLDKNGKADKDRGEVLLDIQFMRNNMTASMMDLSEEGKSRSRMGKLKDKIRGKKAGLSDSASAVVPASSAVSNSQVLTDSEGEGEDHGDDTGDKKKKSKIKSLFTPKSNLQRNVSQSSERLGALLEKNSTLRGSRSSGLSMGSSEAGEQASLGGEGEGEDHLDDTEDKKKKKSKIKSLFTPKSNLQRNVSQSMERLGALLEKNSTLRSSRSSGLSMGSSEAGEQDSLGGEEEGEDHVDDMGDKKKKKSKIKSLFTPKSNLQHNVSQSMGSLPEKNSILSSSRSSGLSVGSLEAGEQGSLGGEGEGEDHVDDMGDKKKKSKIKSLFAPKSNLQRNISQSSERLGALLEKNSTLRSSRSSGISVGSSEAGEQDSLGGEEEGEDHVDDMGDKKKKKSKIKSLFTPKSNLLRNVSQSMERLGALPEKNSTLSGSRSSGLSVGSSEAGERDSLGGEEEGEDHGDDMGDKKKKKSKIKSLFTPKSNLLRNVSQSMGSLPEKNSTLSGGQSSGLNVDSLEGGEQGSPGVKKKFKLLTHKRTGSSDSKGSLGSLGSLSKPAGAKDSSHEQEQERMREEQQKREKEQEEMKRREEEEMRRRREEEEMRRRREEEEEMRRREEEMRKREEEEMRRRREEEMRKREEEEEMRREEEMRKREEEEEMRRREEELMRRREEEELRRRKEEEEMRRREEELEMKRREEEVMRRKEEEMRRIEEEEIRKREEEEMRRRREEELRKREEEEEMRRREEEEMKKREEEEEMRRREEEEIKKREEEEEIRRREEEEMRRREEEEEIKREEQELENNRLGEAWKEQLSSEEEAEADFSPNPFEQSPWDSPSGTETHPTLSARITAVRPSRGSEGSEYIDGSHVYQQTPSANSGPSDIPMMRRLEGEPEKQLEEQERRREEQQKREKEEEEMKRREEEEMRRREEELRKREEEEMRRKEEEEMRRRKEEEEEMRRREEEEMRRRQEEEEMRRREEEMRRKEEEEMRRREEEELRRKKEEEEEMRRREEELEMKRREEEELRRKKEEEMRRKEEEEMRRREEEEMRRRQEEEEMRRREEEEMRRRREEEEEIKRREEEEMRRRQEEEEMRRREEEKRRRREEEEEIKRREEEETRREEEELRRKKEEEMMRRKKEEEQEMRRKEEEEMRRRQEEEEMRRREEEMRRKEEEEMRRREEEELRRKKEEEEEMRRREEELEMKRREEEELRRKKEEEMRRKEEEEMRRREEEEMRRRQEEEEMRRREEEEMRRRREEEEEIKSREEEEMKKREEEEEMRRREEEEMKKGEEEEMRRREEEEEIKREEQELENNRLGEAWKEQLSSEEEAAADFSPNPFEQSPWDSPSGTETHPTLSARITAVRPRLANIDSSPPLTSSPFDLCLGEAPSLSPITTGEPHIPQGLPEDPWSSPESLAGGADSPPTSPTTSGSTEKKRRAPLPPPTASPAKGQTSPPPKPPQDVPVASARVQKRAAPPKPQPTVLTLDPGAGEMQKSSEAQGGESSPAGDWQKQLDNSPGDSLPANQTQGGMATLLGSVFAPEGEANKKTRHESDSSFSAPKNPFDDDGDDDDDDGDDAMPNLGGYGNPFEEGQRRGGSVEEWEITTESPKTLAGSTGLDFPGGWTGTGGKSVSSKKSRAPLPPGVPRRDCASQEWGPAVSPPPSERDRSKVSTRRRAPQPGGGAFPGGQTLLQVQVSPSEPQPITVQNSTEGGGTAGKGGPPSASCRPHPVKPLSSLESHYLGSSSAGDLVGTEGMQKVIESMWGGGGPYSQLSHSELATLVMKQQDQLSEKDNKIRELEEYIDNLLVRIMDEQPSILLSMSTAKKAS